jgi:hypothetical protein
MTAYIQSLIDGGTAPAPDGETCYLLYLPDGVSIASGPGPFSAYHSPYPAYGEGLGDGWAVVSRATPYGGGETQLEELTRVASHEVLEAATDPGWTSYAVAPAATPPWKGSVWSVFQVPGPVEAGDLCEGTRTFEPDGGSEYQRILAPSPPANGDPCLPAPAEPYYDVSAPADWYALGGDAGTVSISITGWSEAATDDWLVIATVAQASAGFASVEGDAARGLEPARRRRELPRRRHEQRRDGVARAVGAGGRGVGGLRRRPRGELPRRCGDMLSGADGRSVSHVARRRLRALRGP